MHPIEHIGYFSCLLIHFVVPSHPVHFFYDAQLTALTPAQGHTGFEGPIFAGKWPVGDYFHYLHHRHVSCNFGGGGIPWDKWLGRYYGGEGPYKTKAAKKEA
jgi:sterol desaturase/sphingolipid hydroxylase (fatty acid hydroxylase superfamily)